MSKVKITVVKRACHKELIDKYLKKEMFPKGFESCEMWQDGQEFIVEDWPEKPADFPCDWAWTDIQRDVAMIMFDATPPWMKQKGATITCCSDGFRPVSFLVERVES